MSIHFAPGIEVETLGPRRFGAGPLLVQVTAPPGTTFAISRDRWAATGFGARQPASALHAALEATLPLRLTTVISCASPAPAPTRGPQAGTSRP